MITSLQARVDGCKRQPAHPRNGYIRRVSDLPDPTDSPAPTPAELRARVLAGGTVKYHQANAAKGKLFARERVRLLVDEGSFVEDGALANIVAGDLPADGVVTGTARVAGR